LSPRWRHALEAAAPMADDDTVPAGTRYDALRMLGVQPWDRSGRQLVKYLAKGTHDELQMGAVSGLGDMPDERATRALIEALAGLSQGNRNLAFDALIRDKGRISALLDAVQAGKVAADGIGAARAKRIKEHPDANVRGRAAKLLN
jgi:HEAT repeat protein